MFKFKTIKPILSSDVAANQNRILEYVELLKLEIEKSFVSVEVGNNSNGRYTKFSDGTMICEIGTITITGGTLGSSNGAWEKSINWTFPHPFSENPRVFVSGDIGGLCLNMFTSSAASKTGVTLFAAANIDFTNISVQYNAMAIGRWKQ